jgi:hypothetical protein
MTEVLALLLAVVFGALRTRRDLVAENCSDGNSWPC